MFYKGFDMFSGDYQSDDVRGKGILAPKEAEVLPRRQIQGLQINGRRPDEVQGDHEEQCLLKKQNTFLFCVSRFYT